MNLSNVEQTLSFIEEQSEVGKSNKTPKSTISVTNNGQAKGVIALRTGAATTFYNSRRQLKPIHGNLLNHRSQGSGKSVEGDNGADNHYAYDGAQTSEYFKLRSNSQRMKIKALPSQYSLTQTPPEDYYLQNIYFPQAAAHSKKLSVATLSEHRKRIQSKDSSVHHQMHEIRRTSKELQNLARYRVKEGRRNNQKNSQSSGTLPRHLYERKHSRTKIRQAKASNKLVYHGAGSSK